MRKFTKNGLSYYKFHLIEGFSDDLNHVVTTRAGGVSAVPFDSLNVALNVGDDVERVKENRRRIQALGFPKIIAANQTHSRNVLVIDEKNREQILKSDGEIDNVDAFVTNQKDIGLMIKVADCQAILLFDPVMKILAVAHAGWKGLKQNISVAVVNEMLNLGARTENIMVGISPSLGPQHSEFTDPLGELGIEFSQFIRGRYVDLWEFSKTQLIRLGIDERKIEIARIDTADQETGHQFFSYRRDQKVTGRFALVAALK